MEKQSLSQKIIRNTFFNIIGRFWGILVLLFLTPYIISRIGIERYGIWAIIGAITGYFGLLDFGVGTSFVKYIAEFYAKKEYEKINEVINTGFIFYLIFAVLSITLGFFIIDPLLNFFNVPPHLYKEALFVFILGIILFGVVSVLSPFVALQTGLQRMDITNKVAIAMSLPAVIGTIFFLEAGYGLPGLMVNNAIILVITSIANLIIAFKILPKLIFNPLGFSKKMFKKLINFGYKMQITRVTTVVTAQTDKILIIYFLSIGLVAFYHLGSTIVYYTMAIPSLLVSALMPAFSEIEAGGERNKLIDAYLRSTKYLTFFTAPMFIFLITSAPHIMAIWMGQGYGKSSLIIQILAMGWMINTMAQAAVSTCIAIDKPQLMATSSIIIISLNIVLSIFLIKTFGFFGAAWGTMLAVSSGAIYFLIMLHKDLNIPVRNLAKITIPYVMICVFAAGVVFAVDMIINQFSFITNRAIGLAILFVRGLVFLGVYIIGVYFGKLFDSVDINFFQQKLPLTYYLFKKLFLKTCKT